MSVSGPENTLPPLVGHTATRAALAMLLSEGKMPHAVLVHGPRGIGKRLLATHLAWRLICGPAAAEDTSQDSMFGPAEPQAAADAFVYNATGTLAAQLAAGSCPDLHILAPEEGKKSIGVKAVTHVLEVLRRSADTARVCIIDSVDDLTEEAANMLLKSLEEPRTGIYFILVSHQISRVLPTIRSRCRLMRLLPLTTEETALVLQQHDADASLAAAAHGAPGAVLGAGADKRLKLTAQLQEWRRGGEAKTPAANSEGLLPTLSQLLADDLRTHGTPSLATAEAYRRLQQLADKQAEMNLPAALVGEAALKILPR